MGLADDPIEHFGRAGRSAPVAVDVVRADMSAIVSVRFDEALATTAGPVTRERSSPTSSMIRDAKRNPVPHNQGLGCL